VVEIPAGFHGLTSEIASPVAMQTTSTVAHDQRAEFMRVLLPPEIFVLYSGKATV